MRCEDCGIDMKYIGTKEMIGKVWDKFVCPRCKNSFHQAIALIKEKENK